jgi:apolipoprotein N-acyltransferase
MSGRPERRRGSVAGPMLVAGVLGALSMPPWGFWPLGILATALLWWRLEGLRMRGRLLAGWVFGLGLFLPGLWWATSFNVYGGIVLILVEALAPAIGAAVSPNRAGRLLALPGAMVLAEKLRDSWPFGGLPLGSLALGQAAGPLADVARLGGPLLVVGVLWLLGCALGAAVVAVLPVVTHRHGSAASPDGHVPRGRLVSAAVGVVAAVGIAAVAAVAPAGGPNLGAVRVAAVQGGGRRGVDQAQVPPSVVFDAQLAATAEIPGFDAGAGPASSHGRTAPSDRPSLVLWPEDVVSLPGPLAGSPAKAVLAATARRLHASMVVGVTEDVGATRFRNLAVAFGPNGREIGHYEKVHRVPFGEYVPYRSFFSHLANLSAVPRDAIPGHGDGVLHTPVATLGTMISFEVFFPGRGRDPTIHGADLLIVPTNTSSYRTSQVPTQEVAADQLQAISEGRYLVQAAPTGYSDVVTPTGAVLQRSVLGERQVLLATVHLRRGLTLFARAGDGPLLVAAGVCLALGWLWAWWTARNRRSGDRPAPAVR